MLKYPKLLTQLWHPHKLFLRNHPYPTSFQTFLQRLPQLQCTRLDNGLTVASEVRECSSACVGLYIKAGSRYESICENGITHFFEHLAFKGTHARSKTDLENEISSVGAHLHCFTTREMTGYYAECLSEDLPLVVDILSDCIFNNSFSESDITNQKEAVYREMIKYDNNHNQVLFDYLHSTAFQGTPLANTVMGPSSNINNFDQCTISKYMQSFFDPARTVLVAVGDVKHSEIMCLAQSCLNKVEATTCVDMGEYRFTGSEIRFRDDSMPIANVAVAVEGPSFCDPDSVVLDVAASLVGAWDRSKPGGKNNPIHVARCASSGDLCDSYKSFNIGYQDTSLWGVQYTTTSPKLEDMLSTIQDEWMRLCNMVTDREVERAKRQLKFKLLSMTGSKKDECHDIARWVLYNGHRPPLYERILSIEKTFASDIKRVCGRYIYDRCPAVAAVGQTEGLPDYTRIRAGMYWLRI